MLDFFIFGRRLVSVLTTSCGNRDLWYQPYFLFMAVFFLDSLDAVAVVFLLYSIGWWHFKGVVERHNNIRIKLKSIAMHKKVHGRRFDVEKLNEEWLDNRTILCYAEDENT